MLFQKKRYGKRLIYSVTDKYGLIEIVESDNVRCLHFGTPSQQSRIHLNNPKYPVMEYIKYMCSAFFLMSNPKRILVLGLGGGSLPKFVDDHFANCIIDIVELRKMAGLVARKFFQFPESPKIHLKYIDCQAFILSEHSEKVYDMIFFDAYTPRGIAEAAKRSSVLMAASSLLTHHGIMIMNLWSNTASDFSRILSGLNEIFIDQLLTLRCVHSGNVITFSANRFLDTSADNVRQAAARLSTETGIDFMSVSNRLIIENRLS